MQMHQSQMWVRPACGCLLTLWREESREPVSCRKTLSDFTPRVRMVFGFLAKPFPGCDKHHVPSEKPGAGRGSCFLSSVSTRQQLFLLTPALPQFLFYIFMDMGHSLRPLRGKGGWTVEAMDLGTPGWTGRNLSICF